MSRKWNTLDSIKKGEDRPDLEASDEGSDDEGQPPREPNSYYVGGSENSGQQVLDNPDEIMRQMQQRLAQRMQEGQSTRLNSAGARGPAVKVTVEIYDDGFTVDDSSLRSYDVPTNQAFMDMLKKRETPPELLAKHGNRPIDVHVFKKPGKYVFKPFSGQGHRLGAVVPDVVNLDMEDVPEMTTDTGSSMTETMRKRAQDGVRINEAEPTTRIQFRFPNGHRIMGTFNQNAHTVHHHLRTFAVMAEPALAYQTFSFTAGFPPTKIDDEQKTIAEAELCNAVVNVRVG